MVVLMAARWAAMDRLALQVPTAVTTVRLPVLALARRLPQVLALPVVRVLAVAAVGVRPQARRVAAMEAKPLVELALAAVPVGSHPGPLATVATVVRAAAAAALAGSLTA